MLRELFLRGHRFHHIALPAACRLPWSHEGRASLSINISKHLQLGFAASVQFTVDQRE